MVQWLFLLQTYIRIINFCDIVRFLAVGHLPIRSIVALIPLLMLTILYETFPISDFSKT